MNCLFYGNLVGVVDSAQSSACCLWIGLDISLHLGDQEAVPGSKCTTTNHFTGLARLISKGCGRLVHSIIHWGHIQCICMPRVGC